MEAAESSADELSALMVRYQAGDGRAFDEIYRALSPILRRYLISLTRNAVVADDLLQETFLQLHRARHTYRPDRPVRPWAFAIARHAFLMDRRTKARKGFDLFPEGEAPDLPVPPEVEGLADRQALARALRGVPEDRREALVLHHVVGLSFQEIGATLGIRGGAAKLRAHRGMVKLRELLLGAGRKDEAESSV